MPKTSIMLRNQAQISVSELGEPIEQATGHIMAQSRRCPPYNHYAIPTQI